GISLLRRLASTTRALCPEEPTGPVPQRMSLGSDHAALAKLSAARNASVVSTRLSMVFLSGDLFINGSRQFAIPALAGHCGTCRRGNQILACKRTKCRTCGADFSAQIIATRSHRAFLKQTLLHSSSIITKS